MSHFFLRPLKSPAIFGLLLLWLLPFILAQSDSSEREFSVELDRNLNLEISDPNGKRNQNSREGNQSNQKNVDIKPEKESEGGVSSQDGKKPSQNTKDDDDDDDWSDTWDSIREKIEETIEQHQNDDDDPERDEENKKENVDHKSDETDEDWQDKWDSILDKFHDKIDDDKENEKDNVDGDDNNRDNDFRKPVFKDNANERDENDRDDDVNDHNDRRKPFDREDADQDRDDRRRPFGTDKNSNNRKDNDDDDVNDRDDKRRPFDDDFRKSNNRKDNDDDDDDDRDDKKRPFDRDDDDDDFRKSNNRKDNDDDDKKRSDDRKDSDKDRDDKRKSHDRDDDDDDDFQKPNPKDNDDDDKKKSDHNDDLKSGAKDDDDKLHMHLDRYHRDCEFAAKLALGCFIIGWFMTFLGLRFYHVSLFSFGLIFFEGFFLLFLPLGASSCAYLIYGLVSIGLSRVLLFFHRVAIVIGAFLMALFISSITTTAIIGPIISIFAWVIILLSVFLGTFSIIFPKLGVLLSSSFIGSFIVIASFDFLTRNNGGLLYSIRLNMQGIPWVRDLTWIFVIIVYILAAIGFFVQLITLARRKGRLFDRVLHSEEPSDRSGYDSFDDDEEAKKKKIIYNTQMVPIPESRQNENGTSGVHNV